MVPANNYFQFMHVYNTPVTNRNGSKGGLLDPYIIMARPMDGRIECFIPIRAELPQLLGDEGLPDMGGPKSLRSFRGPSTAARNCPAFTP